MNCEAARLLLQERAITGTIDALEHAIALEEHLAGCAACREERRSLEELLAGLPDAVLAPPTGATPASERVRERLLADTRHGRALPSFAGAVARLFDLPHDEARALLAELERPEGWRPSAVPGHWQRLVKPGPGAGTAALAMLLRTAPGTLLPLHRHVGPERTFVLQGGYEDSAGREVWAGEYADQPAGTQHQLRVLPPVDCIAAVLVQGGMHVV
jgi:anti-sigma factor ChrR (cupin superfamily)